MIWSLPALYDKSYVQRSSNDITYTTITADASTHTKGAWTEIVPAAGYTFDVGVIVLRIQGVALSGSNSAMLIDIGVGAAASEIVLVPNILAGGNGASPYWLPMFVPAGTRISARCQAAISADTANINIDLYGGAGMASHPMVYHAVENCGANTADSDGVSLTVGSWVQLKASTDYDAVAAVPMFSVGGNVAGADNLASLGIGPAASEVAIFDRIKVATGSAEIINENTPTGIWPMNIRIPAGTRIVGTRNGGDRSLDGAVLLFR